MVTMPAHEITYDLAAESPTLPCSPVERTRYVIVPAVWPGISPRKIWPAELRIGTETNGPLSTWYSIAVASCHVMYSLALSYTCARTTVGAGPGSRSAACSRLRTTGGNTSFAVVL